MIGDGNTDTVSILDPVLGASEADLIVPIPGGTSEVSGLHVVGFREDAFSFNEVVSLVASSAVTIFGVFSALVRDGNTNFVSIKDPSS